MTVYTVLNQKVSEEIFNHFITVESEIHNLQSQLKQKDEEIDKLYDIIQAKNIEESFIKSELIGVTEQLKEKDQEIEKVIWILGDYLAGYDPSLEAKEWLEKHKEIK